MVSTMISFVPTITLLLVVFGFEYYVESFPITPTTSTTTTTTTSTRNRVQTITTSWCSAPIAWQRYRGPLWSPSSSLSSSSSSSQFPTFLDWSHDSRINVLNLLTQRSIQSFIFLCESVRDPHSGKWIQDFLQCPNQLEFHGTGANYVTTTTTTTTSNADSTIKYYDSLSEDNNDNDDSQTTKKTNTAKTTKARFESDGTWDGPILAMIEQPKDVVIVSAKRRGAGHGGWSKHNPYLQDRYVEFEIDVDPVSLASRIVSVREQIAKEWETDLDILAHANDQILSSYFELAKIERTKRDSELVETPSVAFERTAVNLMNNQTIFTIGSSTSSPLRKGNFDLLYNLCTQASIHRLLRQLKEDGESKEVSFEWLREFYADRVDEYFDGDQPYGRADDFIEELLLSSPSVIHLDDGSGRVALADPFGLAEKVIETRNDIVQEWKEAMVQVPTDHQDGIRRLLLNKQMEAWGSGGGGGGGTLGDSAVSDSGGTSGSETKSSGPSFQ